jgi:hypothetical protein
MKKITLQNYKQDTYFPRIVAATAELLLAHGYVAPVMLFQKMELLSAENAQAWRQGKVPFLEQVIQCNLSKASRILRIFRFHAHDMNLIASHTDYKRKSLQLRFSKSGEPKLEEAYSTHLVSPKLSRSASSVASRQGLTKMLTSA